MYQAHYALRKHLRDGNPDYDDICVMAILIMMSYLMMNHLMIERFT